MLLGLSLILIAVWGIWFLFFKSRNEDSNMFDKALIFKGVVGILGLIVTGILLIIGWLSI